MCELLGINTKKPIDASEYLKAFYSHSVRHPNGWGIMRRVNGGYEIYKEAVSAENSPALPEVIASMEKQTDMLAHIRLATVGGMKQNNSHPFTGTDSSGRVWTMIHNGTIYSGTQLMKYLSVQSGDTDSERIFLYLLDKLNLAMKGGAVLGAEKRFEIIDELVRALSPRNKLNLMIFDGEILYVHKNMKNTLSFKHLPEGYVFSTEPLDDNGWQRLPIAQLQAYRNGERILEGEKHGNVFIPTLDYINAMAAMNI